MNANIIDAIERSDAIPSMPQVVTRLLEITSHADYAQKDVVAVLSTDAGVAGDLLRLANSALFGVTRQVKSLAMAANLLGIKRIRTLVIGRAMVDRINSTCNELIDAGYYWRRSLATGVLAGRFADQIAPTRREGAFMSGLLSDVGVMVLARAVLDQYAEVAERFAPLPGRDYVDRERAAVGVTHPIISALTLERWMLPEEVVAAVRHHHDYPPPDHLGEGAAALARAVNGAADIARLMCEEPDRSTIADTCQAAMATVGLNTTVLRHILGDIESDVSNLASVLRTDVIPSRVYAVIAETISETQEASTG